MQVLLTEENTTFKDNVSNTANIFFRASDKIDLKELWKHFYNKKLIHKKSALLNKILFTQALCNFDSGIGLFLLTQFTTIEIIENFGSESLKEKYLDDLLSGNIIGCFSLTEPNAGSDVSMIETTAKKEKNNCILNGSKIWASNGSISDIIITFAQTKTYKDKTGISCFLISSKDKNTEISTDIPKLGVKITPSNEIRFKNAITEEQNQIGNDGDGIKIALHTITTGRLFCAAQAIGLLERILSEVIKHSTRRNQFGRSISEYQSIKWYIADMTKDFEAGRLLLYKACWIKENQQKESNKYSSMAKYFCSNIAQKHSAVAVQILGGKGLMESSFVSKAYRDSKVLEIYEGTNEIQKIIIAKELSLN